LIRFINLGWGEVQCVAKDFINTTCLPDAHHFC